MYSRRGSLRRILRYFGEEFNAPRVEKHVAKTAPPDPRNVTVAKEERDALLASATPDLRCWLLLCSDLAIRSGTASRLSPENYDAATRTLTFRTKYNRAMTLPATRELHKILAPLAKMGGSVPFVSMLNPNLTTVGPRSLYRKLHILKETLGMTRHFTLHDLRRTTAVAVLERTKDLRKVQAVLGHKQLKSTLHYLDHRITPVSVSTLEAAKQPSRKKGVQ